MLARVMLQVRWEINLRASRSLYRNTVEEVSDLNLYQLILFELPHSYFEFNDDEGGAPDEDVAFSFMSIMCPPDEVVQRLSAMARI